MTGFAEVKAALALARAMRRPAGSLMALLDQAERAISLGELAPDLFAADPTRLLAALLATPVGEADQIRARRRVRPTLPAREPVPGSAHPPSTGRAAPAVVGPAGIVAAARDALRQVRAIATEPAAAVMGSPAGRETISSATLGPLRDALRRSIAAPASQDPKPAASSDHGIAGVTDRIPSPIRDRWRDTAAEIPMPAGATDEQLSATAGDALQRRFADTAPTSRSASTVAGDYWNRAAEGTAALGSAGALRSPAARGMTGPPTAAIYHAMAARDGASDNLTPRDRATPTALAAEGPLVSAARRTALSPTNTSREVPAAAVPRSASAAPELDDEATRLAEASWRHGVDLSWP